MKISIEKALKYKIYYPLLILLFLIFVVYAFMTKDNLFYLWIGISLIPLFLYIILIIKKPYYFFIETTYNKIIIRFFNPHPFLRKNKAIQIPVNKFAGYEISEKLNGFIKFLTIKIRDNKKVMAYKPLSISLLKSAEIETLKKELDTILKINNI